jgi:hypothetical protein
MDRMRGAVAAVADGWPAFPAPEVVEMKISRLWHAVLALVLVFWGLLSLDWVSFRNAGDVLGIGAIVAGVLLLIDK